MDVGTMVYKCLIAFSAVLLMLGSMAQAYMGPSCRSCIVSGDWASCATCYSSKPSIVPFYGMGKRSGGDYGFLPGNYYGNYRGDSLYGSMYKRSDQSFGEMRKRSDYLASYCCLQLRDDDCCDAVGLTPYFGKRSSDMEEPYYIYEEDSCSICMDRDLFDYEYCLQCIKKRK